MKIVEGTIFYVNILPSFWVVVLNTPETWQDINIVMNKEGTIVEI